MLTLHGDAQQVLVRPIYSSRVVSACVLAGLAGTMYHKYNIHVPTYISACADFVLEVFANLQKKLR